ncbi:MAG: hypothetical protein KKD53_06985 [Proteobacteria bacterium]|nr:hypothetical protein [Pseudomonadota bacterium]
MFASELLTQNPDDQMTEAGICRVPAVVRGNQNKKTPAEAGVFLFCNFRQNYQQPQEPPLLPLPQELPQLPPPPPRGLAEEMPKPDRGPASMKSTLMTPH